MSFDALRFLRRNSMRHKELQKAARPKAKLCEEFRHGPKEDYNPVALALLKSSLQSGTHRKRRLGKTTIGSEEPYNRAYFVVV